MKRVRCPKCEQYITFDETQYTAGQSLVFKCPDCGKEFGIRMGVSKLRQTQKEENEELNLTKKYWEDIIQENEQKLNIFCTSLDFFLYLCACIISFYHH